MMQKKMEEKIPSILQKIISFYARQYTVEELGALNTFYSSPAEYRELHAFFLSPVRKKAGQVKKKLSDIMAKKISKMGTAVNGTGCLLYSSHGLIFFLLDSMDNR